MGHDGGGLAVSSGLDANGDGELSDNEIADGLVRLSAGLEEADDLVADLEQAFDEIRRLRQALPEKRPLDARI